MCSLITVSGVFYFSFSDFIYLFSEKGEGREKEKKRNINVQEVYRLVASHRPPPTGDLV